MDASVQIGTNQWLKVTEVAELLQLPRNRTYELIHRGELPAVRVGERSIRVHRGELERFLLEERRVAAKLEQPETVLGASS